MSAEPVETLVERVRDALVNYGTWRMQKPRREKALAALTELEKRLEAREKVAEHLWEAEQKVVQLTERLEAAERERQWLLDREKHHESAAEARVAELEQQLLNAREASGGPQDKRVAELEERLRGAGNAQDLAHFKYAELQARVTALEEALREIATYGDASSRQSGEKDIARAALRVEGDAASEPNITVEFTEPPWGEKDGIYTWPQKPKQGRVEGDEG